MAGAVLLLRMAYAQPWFDDGTWLALLVLLGCAGAAGALWARARRHARIERRATSQFAAGAGAIGLFGLSGAVVLTGRFLADLNPPYAVAHGNDPSWWWRYLLLFAGLSAVAILIGLRTSRGEAAPAAVAAGVLGAWLGIRMATTDLMLWTYAGLAAALGLYFAWTTRWPSGSTPFARRLRHALTATGIILGGGALVTNLGLAVSGRGSGWAQTAVYLAIGLAIFGSSLRERRPVVAYGGAAAILTALTFAVIAAGQPASSAGYAYGAFSWFLIATSVALPDQGRWIGQHRVWQCAALAVATLPVGLGAIPENALEPGSGAYQQLVLAVLSAAGVTGVFAYLNRHAIAGHAASLLGLAALLMQIAATEPANIQAYSVPVAVYLLVLGWLKRRDPFRYDALTVAGAATLMVPAFGQSFGAGGYQWALICGLEALLLVIAGLIAQRRAPLAAGIVGLTAIVLRQTVDYVHSMPTWAILLVVGVALLGVGTALLSTRDHVTGWLNRAETRWHDMG
jgi:hypothetical protein